jgi:hypothetical protein
VGVDLLSRKRRVSALLAAKPFADSFKKGYLLHKREFSSFPSIWIRGSDRNGEWLYLTRMTETIPLI